MTLPVQRVDSIEDPRVADFVSVKEASLVMRRGMFLAEGPEVVRTLVRRGRFRVRSLFLSERRVEAMQDVLQDLPGDAPVYVASQSVMDGVLGFHFHRGCIAAGERGAPIGLDALLKEARTVVVLEEVCNHDNVGGIFRNALAFGADAVLLGSRAADPLYRKAIRVSMGAVLRVPFARAPDGELPVRILRARGFTCCALTPAPSATPIHRLRWPERVALFLGAEGPGLEEETLAACDLRARIPMAPGVDSLNVATASGVALFSRYAARDGPARDSPADPE